MLLSPLRLAGLLLVVGALTSGQPGFALTLTLTLGALLAVLVVGRRAVRPAVAPVRAAALRERARTREHPRQCDPDAAGRPRSRAPSLA